MQLTILEKKKNHLVFEVAADHTFCNALKKELWNDKSITVSGYTQDHIQVGNPRFMVDTTGDNDPKKVVLDALKRLKKENATFLKEFKEAK